MGWGTGGKLKKKYSLTVFWKWDGGPGHISKTNILSCFFGSGMGGWGKTQNKIFFHSLLEVGWGTGGNLKNKYSFRFFGSGMGNWGKTQKHFLFVHDMLEVGRGIGDWEKTQNNYAFMIFWKLDGYSGKHRKKQNNIISGPFGSGMADWGKTQKHIFFHDLLEVGWGFGGKTRKRRFFMVFWTGLFCFSKYEDTFKRY